MRRPGVWLVVLLVLAGALGGCGGTSAIAVRDAWTRPARAASERGATSGTPQPVMGTMMGGANSVAYLTIANTGDRADTLTAAASPIAGAIELHRTEIKDNVASMRQVREIEIPAHGEVRLDPNGYHLILVNVSRDLNVGDTVNLTLTFKQAGQVQVSAQVRDP